LRRRALIDLLPGTVDLMFGRPQNVTSQVQAGITLE